MKKGILLQYAFVVIIFTLLSCQQATVEDSFRKHVQYLASDELEGREAGTDSEKKAADYIKKEFSNIGLSPMGTDGYFQDFEFIIGKNLGENTFTIDGVSLDVEEEYFPLNYTGNAAVSGEILDVGFGIEAEDLNYNDYSSVSAPTGKIFVINISSPDGIHPHSKYLDYHNVRQRVKDAALKGAIAVILINEDPNTEAPVKNYTEKMARVTIPVVFVDDAAKVNGKLNADLEVSLVDDERTARNVIGYIDNNTENTVIIGAHFDHLGYGEHGGSLYRGDEDQIHNGADDNASGTSMLIEISRAIKNTKLSNSNFLFIAFSGEEKGLLGANYFTKNPTIDLDQVSYMLNMDMVGRLDTADYSLAVSGVGTSPVWNPVLNDNIPDPLKIVTTESGVGPSDHTAFYLSDIPVLHFFTGTHENYHKPSDDADLINYDGMVAVYSYILNVIIDLDTEPKLTFAKTKDSDSRKAPKFSVTLGIIPDYMYDKGGVRIDGVSDDKPAANAGMKKGDILLKLGDYSIDDMYAYMDALSKFKKGDEIIVELKRGDETLIVDVRF